MVVLCWEGKRPSTWKSSQKALLIRKGKPQWHVDVPGPNPDVWLSEGRGTFYELRCRESPESDSDLQLISGQHPPRPSSCTSSQKGKDPEINSRVIFLERRPVRTLSLGVTQFSPVVTGHKRELLRINFTGGCQGRKRAASAFSISLLPPRACTRLQASAGDSTRNRNPAYFFPRSQSAGSFVCQRYKHLGRRRNLLYIKACS